MRDGPVCVLCLLVGLLCCGLWGGCDRGPSAGAPSGGAAAGPVVGGRLTVGTLGDAARLDPHTVTDAASMRVIEPLYSSLLRYDPEDGSFDPDLAERVVVSDDQLVYTVTLVEGATFHSGRPVTSRAVKFSIQRIIEKAVRSGHFAAVASIQTPDRRTVILRLREPVAALASYLAHPMNAIVDPVVVAEHDGVLDQADAGCGPFQLVSWQRDRQVVLRRHEGYHVRGRPFLDEVVFRPVPDPTARTTALRTGELDLVLEVAPKDVPILQGAAGVVLASVPGTFWEYVGLNCVKRPFDDVRVRRAVAMAIDRAQINRLVKFGEATALYGGPIPPNHWAWAGLEMYREPGLAEAGRLLEAAGFGEGVEVELIVDASVSYQVRAAEVIKQQLKAVGIDITLRGLESTVFFDRLGRGDFQMTVVGWMGFVDPDQWTWNLFHSEGRYNQQGYANPVVDRLLDEGRRTLDRSRRRAIYTEAQRLIAGEAPMVFLYVNDQVSAWREHVHGYRVHPTGVTLALRDAWVDR